MRKWIEANGTKQKQLNSVYHYEIPELPTRKDSKATVNPDKEAVTTLEKLFSIFQCLCIEFGNHKNNDYKQVRHKYGQCTQPQ